MSKILFIVIFAIFVFIIAMFVRIVKTLVSRLRQGEHKEFKRDVPNFVVPIFIVIGAIFLVVGLGIQTLPVRPENMNYTVNGVSQAATEQTVRSFKMMFLVGFGGIGAALITAGIIIRRRLARKDN